MIAPRHQLTWGNRDREAFGESFAGEFASIDECGDHIVGHGKIEPALLLV
jgi:hypothetical protein